MGNSDRINRTDVNHLNVFTNDYINIITAKRKEKKEENFHGDLFGRGKTTLNPRASLSSLYCFFSKAPGL